jgi:hypothetical protein
MIGPKAATVRNSVKLVCERTTCQCDSFLAKCSLHTLFPLHCLSFLPLLELLQDCHGQEINVRVVAIVNPSEQAADSVEILIVKSN